MYDYLQYETITAYTEVLPANRKQTPMFRDTPIAFTAMYTGYNVTTNEDEAADGDSSIQLFFRKYVTPRDQNGLKQFKGLASRDL